MIPKKIHQVWVGPADIPDNDVRMAATLKEANPDWELVMHAENPDLFDSEDPWDRIEPLGPSMVEYAIDVLRERCGRMFVGAHSDVRRIEVLLSEGGLYLDTDVFAVKPFGTMFDRVSLGIAQEFSNRSVGNFAIASKPNHPALWRYFTDMHHRMRNFMTARSKWIPVGITGPVPTAEVLTSWHDCVLWPFPLFSPWSPDHQLPEKWWELKWPDATVCVHAFTSKWMQTIPKAPPSTRPEDGMDANWIVLGPRQKIGACQSC